MVESDNCVSIVCTVTPKSVRLFIAGLYLIHKTYTMKVYSGMIYSIQ